MQLLPNIQTELFNSAYIVMYKLHQKSKETQD